jgi:guanylate kinase
MARGPLIIVSGPSGSGKTTVVRRVLADTAGRLPLRQSISATTRQARPGERDGVDYYFWPRERFLEQVQAGAFLEWAEVYGNYYGTLKSEVDGWRDRGTGVFLVIDVQGAATVRRLVADAVTVFLKAPSPGVYEARIRKRPHESEAVIARRLQAALAEEARASEYQHVIVNEDLDTAVRELTAVVERAFIANR